MLADAILGIVVFVILVHVGLVIVSAISAARLPSYAWKAAGISKGRTLWRIRLGGWLGYWRNVRPAVRSARERVAPPPKRDPWSSADDW